MARPEIQENEQTKWEKLDSGEHTMSVTDLGRDGILQAAELLDGTVEVVSAASNNAHHQLQVRLHSGKDLKKEEKKPTYFCRMCFSVSKSLNMTSIWVECTLVEQSSSTRMWKLVEGKLVSRCDTIGSGIQRTLGMNLKTLTE